MELVNKHRECLKRISTPVISIGKRIPEFNRVRLWFDNNLADHFIRFLQGNGNHKRRFSRQNICSNAASSESPCRLAKHSMTRLYFF